MESLDLNIHPYSKTRISAYQQLFLSISEKFVFCFKTALENICQMYTEEQSAAQLFQDSSAFMRFDDSSESYGENCSFL